jgi:putative ABC transport system permease protein
VAVVTLALGIAANAAIFSVLEAVLLAPLPFPEPERIVNVGTADSSGLPGNTGYLTYVDWKAQSHSFEELALIRMWLPTLVTNGQPERINALRVTANFFRTMRVKPALGRDFAPADDTVAGWHVVILSDGLWRRRFNADAGVIGRMVKMNDADYQVIGVMPADFQPLISEFFYNKADMWAALGYDATQPSACRSCQHLKVIGRIRPDTSVPAAEKDIDDVQRRLVAQFRQDYPAASRVVVLPISELLTGGIRPALTALMGAVMFVLLIACANVANLLLARLARRQHDLAMRAALGATRGRIVRQLLLESLVLAFAGGILGLALARAAVPLLVRLAPVSISRLADARVDVMVIAAGLTVSLATTIFFGLLPAMHVSRLDLSAVLAGETRRTSAAPTSPARRMLIGVDVALAVVLLAAAGLMIRSVGRLIGVNPGFDPDGVLTLQISMVGSRYAKDEQVVQTTEQLLARVRALPGVTDAATAGQIPLGGNGDTWGFHVEGRPVTPEDPAVERYSVTPDYFRVMRIPLKRGRLLTDADRIDNERAMLIGERTAETVWPGSDPLGQHVKIGGTDGPTYTVVGIVGDVRHHELAVPPTMQMYLSQWQLTDSFLTVVVRTVGDPARLTADVRRAIWSVAPDVPVYEVASLSELVAKSVAPRRFIMVLLEVFGAIALLMTAIGVYGVIAYSVSERTREIGVRSALGASSADIVRLVVGGGIGVVAAGLGGGILVASITTRFLQSSLFGVSPLDPLTFVGVALVIVVVTLTAQIIPVARALRIDPAVALRID